MNVVAGLVILMWAVVTVYAFVQRPGRLAGDDFLYVWNFSAWGKQFMVDFFGLEIVLALWMIQHALEHDALGFAVGCIALMPILGALPPALYWLFGVVG